MPASGETPASSESEAVERLQRGDSTLDEFLAHKADRALARLSRLGLAGNGHRSVLRDALVFELEANGCLVDEIQALTGLGAWSEGVDMTQEVNLAEGMDLRWERPEVLERFLTNQDLIVVAAARFARALDKRTARNESMDALERQIFEYRWFAAVRAMADISEGQLYEAAGGLVTSSLDDRLETMAFAAGVRLKVEDGERIFIGALRLAIDMMAQGREFPEPERVLLQKLYWDDLRREEAISLEDVARDMDIQPERARQLYARVASRLKGWLLGCNSRPNSARGPK